MSCDRFINRSGDCGQVMGTFGVQRIALRGPGCISGTGLCDGVAGTGGRRCCCCCGEVAGTGGGCGCGNVMGTGGSNRCNNVAGTGGRSRCNNVAGTGGRSRCNNVAGTGGSNRCWNVCDWCLGTPTIVPR
ncbi:hypothetical protein [Sedimentibacter sp.]|uniref:hypothetical protein n=1 Tax=Sedimentibacter sp. TaxID=1960295 RepID=UPI00289AD9A9|nr:hypothetical protein [Sedimentibacter sp.]